MAIPVSAATPGTALRKLWEIVHHKKADTFLVVSGQRGSWAVNAATAAERKSGKLDPHEYVGPKDPKKDAAINQLQDSVLRGYLRNLGRPMVRLDGLGQELEDVVDEITQQVTGQKLLPPESQVAYLVSGVNQSQAEHLCRAFNQDFVLFGAKDQKILGLNWDRANDTFSISPYTFEDTALYKAKEFDPKQGPKGEWMAADPGSATYRSDVKGQSGVGFTFYNEGDVADAISGAAQRLIASGEVKTSLARVERAWMNWSKSIETQVRQIEADGSPEEAKKAAVWFKSIVQQASKDPENWVRFLVKSALPAHTPVTV
jgi:hypothetical protein